MKKTEMEKVNLVALVASMVLALTLLASPSPAYAGYSDSLKITIECGGGYNTVYDAFNRITTGQTYADAFSIIIPYKGDAPSGDIGVQATLKLSNGSFTGFSSWKYNSGYSVSASTFFQVMTSAGASNTPYYSFGNPAVFRGLMGGYFVYKTDRTNDVYTGW